MNQPDAGCTSGQISEPGGLPIPGLRVALVDGGGTNIGSVAYALERLGATARLTSDPAEIAAADRVILPGVGAAGPGMRRLRDADLVQVLRDLEQPLLGVCLGMQLLYEHSAEDGGVECLGLIPGQVVAIPQSPGIRVPHMGWNELRPVQSEPAGPCSAEEDSPEGGSPERRPDPLVRGLRAGDRAYFVHSYAAPVTEHTLMETTHAGRWTAVVRHQNRWGAQFHPERSADVGARLLRNFCSEVT